MGVLHVGDFLYKREKGRIRGYEILAYNKNVKPVELYLKCGRDAPKIYPVTEIGKTLFLSADEVPPKPRSKNGLYSTKAKSDSIHKEDDWSKWDYKIYGRKKKK